MSCLIYTHAKIHKKVEEKKKLFVFLSFLCDFLDISNLFVCNFTLFADIFDVNCHEEGEGNASLRSSGLSRKLSTMTRKFIPEKYRF